MFKLKGRHVRQSQVEKFTRYSIRKVSFGAASVAVATGLFFLGGGSVQAAEQITNSEPTEVQNSPNLNDKSSEPSREVTGQASATAKEPDGQNNTSVKESTTDKQASEVETPNVVAEKVAINTASLEDLVAKVEGRLSQLTEDKKTKSVIDDAKNLVNKAKELLNDDTKTQEKVDAQAKQLSSSLVILNSIKSETTEEKVNKNQDPRNGQAIPGNGESGFRADTFIVNESNTTTVPDTATTGTDKFTFVALPENDPRRNSGAIAIAGGGAGDIVVNGTGEAPTDLEIEMYSSQRTGQTENPKAMSTVNGQPATSPGRMDYPLSKEQVQKLQEEAKLWVGKEKPDGNRVTTNLGAVYGSSGAYEFLATEIYKLGYEQGVDRVYIPNISNRFGVSEKATQAGWKIKSIEPSNLPPGLIYDRESDSIQGRVVANLQNGVYDFRFDVAAENERTRQIVRMKFQNLRSGWIGWQDTQPPKIEVSNDAYEATVGQNVNIEVKYSDDAGSNFSGDKRRVKYTLKDGRVVEIGNQSYRQAVSGLAGHSTTKNQGPAETSIPGVTYDLSRDKTPTEKEANGDEKIFGKGILTGSPTKAGIYTVSVFAKDYNNRNKSDTTWIHSGHEVQKYMTVVVKPTATVKNVHAYATNIPVTISEGASSAELTLPNGKVIKLEAKNGNWTLADGGAVLGPVGGEINVPVSQEDTKDAAVDTIKVKAITENVKATLLRNEIELLGDDGQKHTARLSETTGHWELEDAYKEVRTPTADGGYKLTKRQVYTEVQADGSTNYYIYSYTRTFNANDKVVSVDEVTRPKTVVPRLNTENTEGATTTVEYDAVTKEWKSSDGSNVTATKEGDFWKVRTDSGFTGLIKGSKAESVEDKGSILNDAPTATSTSYTAVKGATVDLVKQASAAVTIKDTEDDATTSPKKETTVTKVTVISPSGQQSEYTDLEQAKAHLLSEVGPYTVKVEVKDSNGNVVTANTDTETGTDKGAETAVNSTTYTITVKDQETKKLYKVEDDTVTNDELKGKVEPTTIDGFTPTKNNFTNIPTTVGKAGQTIPTPASVTYTKGTETIPVETKVDVVVLPKVEPTGVTVLKDSTNLEEAVKAKAVEAANAIATDKIPTGVTVSIKQVKDGTLPQTTTTGVQTPAKVIVEYKDENNNVVETREVDVPVTVVSSTPSKIVVFEGEKPTADQAKEAVTPGTDGTKGEPTTLPETTGKAGATDVKVDVPVTYDNGKLTETVSVPVTVLPKASGEVEVPKGESVDKVKEVAKAKAAALVEEAAFKGKLPTGATVTVGDITEAVAETLTNEKGTNKGVVNVPATYTVDGKTYPTTIPVTINVLGSEPKTVYTVEGTKPDAEKVKNAVTPGNGGTVNAPSEAGLPDTTGKAGATDVTATTTVTYPNGTETVTVPVTVLPKATPEKVTTLKDTTGENLTTAVKEKAQAALGKLTLPSGVTAELDPNQTYAVPATDSNGDKDNVPVKVQYKDATGTVVAEDTINVPVTVVGSTPSKIVVFEGEKPTADQAKAAVTPGTDGTKGEPTTLPETVGKAGATDVKVDVPVTYDNGKLTETVSVPVTVLPKASGEVEVPKGESVDKVKEVAKAKAAALVEAADFKGKLPTGATVTVGDITEAVAATLTNEKGTNKGVVNVPATYTVDGKEYPTTIPVTINVLGSEPKTVYTVEGTKPDAEKVKNAVTPGTGGTVNAPTETALPETTGKVGAKDVTVPTTVTYPTGDETVNVPVEVLPKATPEKVTTLKDTTGENLTTAVKEKAQAALGKLTLPSGVTAELDPNQTYAVPATDSNGDKDNVPVKVQYKDATGTVVAEDTINVPVTVVSSTPSKIVVFEGDEVTADAAKGAVTPGTDGTKGTPVIPTDLTKQSGEKEVTLPVAYDGITEPEQVKVPVTVLPKTKGEVEVQKGAPVDKVKEVAKAKAAALVEEADFKGKLPTGATVIVGDITEAVAETLTNEKGINKGVVNVPATYTVDGKEYPTTIPVTINVLGSEPKTVYTVEGTKPDAEKVKNAVTPGTGGTVNAPTETALPETTGKVGAKDVTVPTTVTYPTGDETVNVPVEVLPKATPEKVTTLKDTTGENLTTAVKEKAQAALGKLTLPSGVTAELDPNQTYAVPATDSNGDKDNVPVKVQYKDATGTVVAEDTINVPVTVVSSTPSKIVVFEGEKPTADQAKEAVTPGTDGTKGEPTTLPETTGKAGATDVKVDVPVTYDNGKLTETVSVPVTVLPKPEADEILVAKNSDKEKAKEKVLAKAKKAIEDATFKGKLPQGATVTVDETATITVPDLTEDTEVDVPVKYTVDGQEKTTTVKVPVTIVEGVPQIVPVKETNDVLPDPEKSIDKTDYPEGATFRYKTPEGQTTPIDVTTPGDKDVIVEVLDPQGNTIVEVPATVRVVGSTPQFVVADPAKKQPEAKDSVTPGEYPEGTTFEYKTPVDTTSAGEKDVTVVAKLNGQPIVEVPAKVVVVDPKTQYVVADPSKPQPDASKSIDPEQYPEGTTFEYKTPVDTTTPGEKDVVVVAKDGEDKLVEVPTKVKVVQGNPQIVPVDEGKKQPSPEDSIDPNDYPDDATFEYKEEVDTSTPGDKKVTVVVKQGDKVLVEVPSTVRVVESYPKYVPVDPAKKQPDPKENINPNDFPTGTTFEYKDNTPVDTATPGEKDVTVVAKLNGQPITEIPATIVVVESKTQYVPVNAENDKKPKPQDSITPDDYPEGSTFEYKTPEGQTTPYDGTTPGEKDVTVVVKDPDGDTIVEVPAKIKVVQGKEQLTPVNAEDKDKPKAEDSITPSDYPEGSTFEYKVPEGQTTPYDGTTPGDKPVTVVVKDKDGKVLVEVPANIKVVESKPTPIETPVTKTPLEKDDYTKGLNIPDGATVEVVGDLPDLTTPGEKTPVKVMITLPNGKSYTVDVPVTVTPVKEIETPVTTDKLTPEDILKQIKVPEGATTKVENIPDLTTPGKKDPVKVTVTLPNGKVVTVDVPVNVTPVKEIETPVTTTPLTPDDYTKGITIPEGGKVTKVENIPDLTTPGKKNPVKVTIELPNGKVITVDVPVTVTPVKEIETPVTTTPLTPEDYTKGITIPEGGKVTKVENIPDLTTPGKKDPVKVTITLPNGKVVTVEVPVNVTPIKDIVKKQGDPITEEDVENHIPKGAKVISIGDKPTTDVPGERPSIPVVIELPNGIRVTVNIPVIVTSKVTPVVVQVGTPVTPEDVKKHIELPKGWKVTKVGEIPTTETPGAKPVVPVEVELPDGRKITVDVPVIVTPTVRQIVVPQGTPITPDDVKGHIDLPKEPGWEIVGVGEIPTTIPAGVKPSVKVKVKVPTGEIIEVDVPVIVTPKVTPIVVEVGTPITEEDVKKKVDLPEGWEIVEVGEIPTTETPGAKPVVKVKVKLPDGRMITVDVPVTVTPKDTPVKPTIKTKPIVVAVGDPVTKEDVELHIDLPKGAEIVEIGEIPTTETPGEKPSVKVKVKLPSGEIVEVDVPVTVTPKDTPTPRPEKPSTTEVKESKDDSKVLPNTGTKGNASLLGLGILGALSGFGLLGRKKKED